MQKSLIRINTSQKRGLVVACLICSVALAHVLLAFWLWGYKPKAQQVAKMFAILEIDSKIRSEEARPLPESATTKLEPTKKVALPKVNVPGPAREVKKPEQSNDTLAPPGVLAPNSEEISLQQQDSKSNDSTDFALTTNGSTKQDLGLNERVISTDPRETAVDKIASSSIDLGLKGKKLKPDAVAYSYDAYLNGSRVASASYELRYPTLNSPDAFEALFRLRATGITALVWRGERIELSSGTFDEHGFSSKQLRQTQGDREARLRSIDAGATDSVSSVFQLMMLGQTFGDEFVRMPPSTWQMQKTSRVDSVVVSLGQEETIVYKQINVRAIPVTLKEESPKQAKPDSRTIWFVPELKWMPIRLIYSDGKYDVELRMQGMPAPLVRNQEVP